VTQSRVRGAEAGSLNSACTLLLKSDCPFARVGIELNSNKKLLAIHPEEHEPVNS
jgi:hypothetical protein